MTDTQIMGKKEPNQVYDVLTGLLGAPERERASFICWWGDIQGKEYRFCGLLGFGGKFWRTNDAWYVNCYHENESPERIALIEEANTAIRKLRELAYYGCEPGYREA